MQLNVIEGTNIPAEVFTSDQPMVLRGLISQWPAVKEYQRSKEALADYLLGYAIEQPVTVFRLPEEADGRVFYNDDLSDFNFTRERDTLKNVFRALLDSGLENKDRDSLYVGSTLIDHWLPGFRQNNDLNLGSRESLVSIWVGGKVRIAAHFDFPHNIACNVGGRRRFTLFPPEQAKNLYIGPIDFTPAGQSISLVDLNNPDFGRFPRFASALENSISVELLPGDAIYIPSMWWHHVESLDDFNSLVNYWWRSTPVYHGSPNNALLHTLLAIKDLPKDQRDDWHRIFNHYVFSDDESRFDHIPESARGILNGIDERTANQLKKQLIKFLQ